MAAGAGAASVSPAPHSMQNFAPPGFSAPQLGQSGVSSAPHDMQKRACSGFSAAQLGHALPSIEAEDRTPELRRALRTLRYAAAPLEGDEKSTF